VTPVDWRRDSGFDFRMVGCGWDGGRGRRPHLTEGIRDGCLARICWDGGPWVGRGWNLADFDGCTSELGAAGGLAAGWVGFTVLDEDAMGMTRLYAAGPLLRPPLWLVVRVAGGRAVAEGDDE
jgi:hypothetical protein